MRYLILGLLFVGIAHARAGHADTDFGCVNACTAQGNQYGLCQSRCSYDSAQSFQMQQLQQQRQTDFACVTRCTGQGLSYGLCTQRCSY